MRLAFRLEGSFNAFNASPDLLNPLYIKSCLLAMPALCHVVYVVSYLLPTQYTPMIVSCLDKLKKLTAIYFVAKRNKSLDKI